MTRRPDDSDREQTFLESPAGVPSDRPAAPEALIGRVVGSYEVLARIGAGGMGDVYKAHDRKLDRPVALKLLPLHLSADADRLRRFHAEARAASSLNHPNILVIHNFGELDGRPFMVTELVEGQTLRQRLAGGPLPVREAIDVALQVAGALAVAHARGLVHRDVKPENVMVRPDGYVKVLDFGLAKLVASPFDRAHESDGGLHTRPGLVMGTPRYMSPEQARGLELDARSDVWSMGIMLYEMIAGHAPFTGASDADLISAILTSDPPPLEQRAAQAPKALGLLIARTLVKESDGRFASARELHEALLALRTQLDSGGHRRASSSRPSTPLRAAVSPARGRQAKSAIESLAVLPFANGSGDPDTDYFCDGVTETMIGSLSTVPRLRVMAHSATLRYKGKDVDPLSVGRELNGRAVLTGRLTQRGDRLAIALELVDVAQGWRLWGAKYDAAVADIFSLEETIATEVSDKLRLQLSAPDRTRLVKRHTQDVRAYQAYLRGRYSWNRRVDAGFRQAIKYFDEAIALDPAYALPSAHVSARTGTRSPCRRRRA